MNPDLPVKTVTVELLRPGPAHNQLLSPVTQYLGICGDAEAGIVSQPYEHAVFLDRMRALRYEGGRDAQRNENDRRNTLREMGIAVGRVLGGIPFLPGALMSDRAGPDTLIHLRLVLTPSELATLPFELAKMPMGPNACTESWLSLQPGTPIVLTRRTRNVSSVGVKWPLVPRILFVSADPAEVPFEEHRTALLDALQPFRPDRAERGELSCDGRCETFGKLLTILKNASFEELAKACSQAAYTHVHILAHGDEDRASLHPSFGMLLGGKLIPADLLASAMTNLMDARIECPSVVTLATCDSGNTGTLLVPGGSMAHQLHLAGIPLVVASQVPLTKAGSTLVVRELYRGLLWCENPWQLLHRVRKNLHSALGSYSHDWASLLAYDALPPDLDAQLEEGRYLRAKAANGAAFARIDKAVADGGDLELEQRELAESLRRLPESGHFALEGQGLRASSYKRLAQIEFRKALAPGCAEPTRPALRSAQLLQQALHHYELAVRGFLVNTGEPVQHMATLHWVLVQQICLCAVLGKAPPPGSTEAARMSARAYLEHPDAAQQAWAMGSLAELALLDICNLPPDGDEPVGRSARARSREEARSHLRELMRLARRLDQPFIIESTLDQFRRYAGWWGSSLLEIVVASLDLDDRGGDGQRDSPLDDRNGGQAPQERSRWERQGVVEVASGLVELLDEKGAAERAVRAAALRFPGGAWPAPVVPPVAAAQAIRPGDAAPASASAGSAPSDEPAILEGAAHAASALVRAGSIAGAFLRVEMLPADHGDCLWIEYGQGTQVSRVLVDFGTPRTFTPHLRPRIEQLKAAERKFDMLLVTHIDADHIGGSDPFMAAANELGVSTDHLWFNGWRQIEERHGDDGLGILGARQGELFEAQIGQSGWPHNTEFTGRAVMIPDTGPLPRFQLRGGMVLTLLSPNRAKLLDLRDNWRKDLAKDPSGIAPGEGHKLLGGDGGDVPQAGEVDVLGRKRDTVSTDVGALMQVPFSSDSAPNNGSSITVLAEYGGKSVLLGADCHAPLLAQSIGRLLVERSPAGQPLKKLKVDLFKVPHHASQNNLDATLLGLLDCRRFLISTSGAVFGHPDPEAIARCIRLGGAHPTLYFNYTSAINGVWADAALQQRYGYAAVHAPKDRPGLLVEA